MDGTYRSLLVAVDSGARAGLKPLSEYDGFYFADYKGRGCEDLEHWLAIFKETNCASLVVGTSDSQRGRNVESAARLGAASAGLKTIVIEDYPGNYRLVDGAGTDLLIVDSAFAKQLHKKNLGAACPPIWMCNNARYDPLRREAAGLRKQLKNIWSSSSRPPHCVLWAGQPETQDAIGTLSRLAPDLVRMGTYVLFKAHPRDPGYGSGVYQDLFEGHGLAYRDVTLLNLGSCMEYGPRVTLTQFSSLAIEAGFYGLPAVHILYKDIGFRRLYRKKGFGIPPWCTRKAAFLITDREQHGAVLSMALIDEQERASRMQEFDDYFGVSKEAAPLLIKKISQTVASDVISPYNVAID